ncbi:MAG: FecCD family ABC transporter permease [Nocardioidaceae bacterium]
MTTTQQRPGPIADESPAVTVRHARRHRAARVTGVTVALAIVCFAVFCVSLSVGDYDIPLPEVVRTLLGRGDSASTFIVNELRLPRALTAVLAGAAFGLSGAIFQTLLRNPLASPDIIGITAGASASAVVCILGFGLSGYVVSGAAFAGALATALGMYVLAWRDGVGGYRLVLIGVAMHALLTSVISYLMTRAQVYDAQQALVWLTGSLNAKTWTTVQIIAWCSLLLFPLALVLGRGLRALQLGDDAARALGVGVERSRLGLLVVAVALAAVATAAAGPVVFVAFVAAPIARRMIGHNGLALVPAALIGAIVMLASDFAAQHAIAGTQFPVGVVTGIVGAPYLLWLLVTTNRVGRGG